MSNENYTTALKELLYKMADDQLIIGHRNSEWTGIGPVLEEDIAFGSLAQDKVGHAFNFYSLLHSLGEQDPDQIAFNRNEKEFKSCHLLELPIGEYDFSLMRHFLFDHAEMLRFEILSNSSHEDLANLAKKYKSEIKYHVFHANTWVKQLAQGNEESKARMQSALNYAYPLAFGIFEPSKFEDTLISENIFAGEEALKNQWKQHVDKLLAEYGLQVPKVDDEKAGFGGRNGYHTEYLQPLLDEMTEVFKMDPSAEW
ncbi:MAG: phenylacetate-CoA oxygenase subunit PaaI [Sphingobacteriales bacterium]|nr:MAG: phenylacetate-CoA oxygenase subunit PaaI [Sphingobacteriales bacterium]